MTRQFELEHKEADRIYRMVVSALADEMMEQEFGPGEYLDSFLVDHGAFFEGVNKSKAVVATDGAVEFMRRLKGRDDD